MTIRSCNNQQQKRRTYQTEDIAVLVDHIVKLKESEKKDKYMELAWELKKLWNMEVTVIPILISALCTVSKELVQGLRDLEIERERESNKERERVKERESD